MQWSLLATLLHVAIAFGFVTGLVGRWVLLTRAARAAEVETAHVLAEAAAPFDRMVVLGSAVVLPAGLLAGWARGYDWLGLGTGWVLVATILYLSMAPPVPLIFIPSAKRFTTAMAEARRVGAWTPELRAAFADPAVAWAHRWELTAVSLILALMVLKPAF